MPSFAPVDDRVSEDGEELPRSDTKSLSVDEIYSVLLIQSGGHSVTYRISLLQTAR